MTRVILIPADVNTPAREVDINLEDFDAMSEQIGCRYIEFVRIADPTHRMVVDETGRLTGETPNPRASILYPDVLIRGTVLIVGWDQSATYRDEVETCAATVPLDGLDDWLAENLR